MADSRHRWFRSVRLRVTAIATVAVAVVLVAASMLLVSRQRAGLIEQLDDSLSTEAERIADAAESGAVPTLDDDSIVVVVDPAGSLVDSSGDDDGGDDISALLAAADAGQLVLDDEMHRIASETYEAPGGGDGLVRIAASLDDVDESVAELKRSLMWIVPSAVLALLAVVWVVVGRTLRPVEQMRAEVAAIGVSELDRRVPEPRSGDEIARLAVTMNDMLARLEHAVRQQQRFVADASHELRTPLTRMRAELEVDEQHPERADASATRRSQLDEITHLQQTIGDLLLLARSDAGATEPHVEPVDLDDIVLDEIRTSGHSAVVVDARRVSAAQVAGGPDELRRVVRNLLDNARRHATSTITVELSESNGHATLVVADDGPGVPEEQRSVVFERFARLEEARTGSGHAGLGLAIVHDIVSRLGGTVTVDDAPHGGARFTVTVPST
jgi:signal transduction histidine kinase